MKEYRVQYRSRVGADVQWSVSFREPSLGGCLQVTAERRSWYLP